MEIINIEFENISILDIQHISSPIGYKIVFLPEGFYKDDWDGSEDMYFHYSDIIHFAIIKTTDEKIRHCICFNEIHLGLIWFDINDSTDKNFGEHIIIKDGHHHTKDEWIPGHPHI
ncbi:MAG: hypothetical protein PHX80_05300 [Candidatus Nanoarchaeia archaeon]|nr:hypothetical protein [Candidatus Nanoarchaeia archaeon]